MNQMLQKKLIALNCLIVFLLCPYLVMAGPGRTGGGNSVICFSDPSIVKRINNSNDPHYQEILDEEVKKITSIETLDLRGARQPHLGGKANPVFDLQPSEDPYSYVKRLALRFDKVMPLVSQILRRGLENIPVDRTKLRQDDGLARLQRINDEKDLAYLSDKQKCVIATTAMQYKSSGLHFVEFDGRLFNHPKNSPLSKAVLVLHEAVYTVFRDQGDEDSRNTRDFIRAIISKDLRTDRLVPVLKTMFPRSDKADISYPNQVGNKLVATLLPELKNAITEEIHRALQDQSINNEAYERLLQWRDQDFIQRTGVPKVTISSQRPGQIQNVFDLINTAVGRDKISVFFSSDPSSFLEQPYYSDLVAFGCYESTANGPPRKSCVDNLAAAVLLASGKYTAKAKQSALGRLAPLLESEMNRVLTEDLQFLDAAAKEQFSQTIRRFCEAYIHKTIHLYFYKMTNNPFFKRPTPLNVADVTPPTQDDLDNELAKISISIR